jgi:hypothetical protein
MYAFKESMLITKPPSKMGVKDKRHQNQHNVSVWNGIKIRIMCPCGMTYLQSCVRVERHIYNHVSVWNDISTIMCPCGTTYLQSCVRVERHIYNHVSVWNDISTILSITIFCWLCAIVFFLSVCPSQYFVDYVLLFSSCPSVHHNILLIMCYCFPT